jgi:hypothetical protein
VSCRINGVPACANDWLLNKVRAGSYDMIIRRHEP